LSNSASFWGQLLARDRDEEYESNNNSTKSERSCCEDARNEFMMQAYKQALPVVKWIPLNIQNTLFASAREGHLSCVLDGPENSKTLVITGGFTDDDGVTVIGIKSGEQTWGWTRLTPIVRSSLVYGASLTALPHVDSGSKNVTIAKAVRFGGFEGGGYSNETDAVWLLTIRDEDHEDGSFSQTASWEKVETSGASPRARAYHSATLIHGRYLLIIGGMTWRGSTIEEAILDTQTWAWIDITLACSGEPSGRHGHSVVWDKSRGRLVMFGGGSGTDLLTSGVDNNEVWELKMNRIEIPSFGGTGSKMWRWSKLYEDTISDEHEDDSDDSDDSDAEVEENNEMEDTNDRTYNNTANNLSPAESLCLGRCHNGMKIAPDTVLLMFGGGRPNTNGVLGYNLRTNAFIRPLVRGPMPMSRFTGIALFLDTEGYVFIHGGYNGEESATIQDMHLLDLGPLLNRNFNSLPVDTNRRSNRVVTDEEAESGGRMSGYNDERSVIPMDRFLMHMLSQQYRGLDDTEGL